jgi:murein DD-endopeptidase MepM/ murein hydrolase activator NlpD
VRVAVLLLAASTLAFVQAPGPPPPAGTPDDQTQPAPHVQSLPASLSSLATQIAGSGQRLAALQRRLDGIGGITGVALLRVDRAYDDLGISAHGPAQGRLADALRGLGGRLSSTDEQVEALQAQLDAVAIRLDGQRRTAERLQTSFRAERFLHGRDRSPTTTTELSLGHHLLAWITRLGHEVATLRMQLDAIGRDAARLEHGPIGDLARALGGDGSVFPVVFLVCPVDPPRSYSDDFGVVRTSGGYHLHMGNDILAPLGTPVRAPFPGTAEVSSNGPGGLAVKVFGAEGFVYNAHLSAFGTLGSVEAGTVIGYVGNTGNAAGGSTHDHFEWHPGGGDAVDPYPYLNLVC